MVERLNNATGALGALKYLQASTKDLTGAEGRLSSGLKVGRARDDAAAFQSAAFMRGQGSSLNAVTLSLGRAESISDTAITATESISKLLTEMKGTAAQAMSSDWSDQQRAAFQQQYEDQMQTLQSFIRKASFDGENTLDGSKPNGVSFIADAEASQTLTLAGRNLLPGAGGIIVAPPSTSALLTPQGAADTHALLEQSIANIGDQLVEMSAERRRIEAQKGFVSRLADALAAGVGRMVDTDLAAESALIQALQVKQELSASAISIANAAPQALLSLFRG
ncbi:MAG: flagellin [Alphaproteobacteria bacterium]|nr:MAG: flagellin [Alphaproteobacteria bacterium]